MTLIRITNVVLALLAAVWWVLNIHNSLAEPIFVSVGAVAVVIEVICEVLFNLLKTKRDNQRRLENLVLPELIDRISREEGNILQVIEGKRKGDKIIEEYPVELLKPHVPKLRELRRYRKLANSLQKELERNEKLPPGSKDFAKMRMVCDEIRASARLSTPPNRCKWMPWLYLFLVLGCEFVGLLVIRLPDEERGSDRVPEKKAEMTDENKEPTPP